MDALTEAWLEPPDRIAPCAILPPEALADVAGPAWQRFVQSWADLPADRYMGDGGTYRRRRHGAFRIEGTLCKRLPHRPHYQERAHNALNGGIERWFEPILPSVASSPAFHAALSSTAALVTAREAVPPPAWLVEAHQFRILAHEGKPGLPTPEGMHRDGRDWVLILLTGYANILGGETRVQDARGRLLLRHRLTQPGEALLLDDSRTRHGTSPIEPRDPDAPAWRDTLVLTFARSS